MKIHNVAVSASTFHDRPLVESVKALADVGVRKIEFSGLSVASLSTDDLRDLKRLMGSEGVTCVSLNAVGDLIPVNLGNLAALQKRERRAAVDHVKRLIEIAAVLGSKTVVMDTGTTTEDIVQVEQYCDREDQTFAASCVELLENARSADVSLTLQVVPGRRWRAWDGYPPDTARVVERHVWPWRKWCEDEEIVKKIENDLGTRNVTWAFDVANEVVAAGTSPIELPGRISYYLGRGLQRVYLANHPGPYNRFWHRLLRHQNLCDGVFTPADFHAILNQLEKNDYDGEVVLLISEKDPSPTALRRSLSLLNGESD